MRPLLVSSVLLVLIPSLVVGATHRTPNFLVTATTEEIAETVANRAEDCREKIAIEWLGKAFPRWWRPCRITVKVGSYLGAGGSTTFAFDDGDVFGWRMTVQGSLERVLDSVIPHEVSHTILATHFRRPLPRWADEGAATLLEHETERSRQMLLAEQVFGTASEIPLRDLLPMQDYPLDMQKMMALYAQGYLLASFLVEKPDGKRNFLRLLEEAHAHNDWEHATNVVYGYTLEELENEWKQWMKAGYPPPPPPILAQSEE